MTNPAISVILPVHNGGAFLSEAVNSILNQSFTDFECLISNDGSTDQSAAIIESLTDCRVVKLSNEGNKGLIYTLNRGIELSKGTYIARMDADDISLPERFKLQKQFLDDNKTAAAVAGTVIFIDESGKETGNWELDKKTITPSQIKKTMPAENCIAHPSVMLRAEVIRQLRYNPAQKNIEDYDLWLRILNRGYSIAKISKPLLLYRVHQASVTGTVLKKKNFFFKHAGMKFRFIWHEMIKGKITFFMLRVKLFMLLDILKGTGKAIKQIFRK